MVSSWLGDQVSDLTSAMIVIGCHQPDVTSPCPLHPSTVAKWIGQSFYNIISVPGFQRFFIPRLQEISRQSSRGAQAAFHLAGSQPLGGWL